MAVNYNSKIVTDGLVLCLDAANKRSYPGSGTVWYDLSGNQNNGSIINGPIFTGDSFTFDGIDDYVRIPHSDSLNILSGYCVEIWFQNITTAISANKSLFEKGINKIIFQTHINGLFYGHYVQTPSSINQELLDKKWHNLVMSYSSSFGKIYLYLDGVLRHNGSIGSLSANSDPIDLMARAGSIAINGKVSLLKVYKKYLFEQEILQNFNATRGRYLV